MASSGGGKTSDEIVFELADSILGKVPEKLDIDKALPEMFEVCIKIEYPRMLIHVQGSIWGWSFSTHPWSRSITNVVISSSMFFGGVTVRVSD